MAESIKSTNEGSGNPSLQQLLAAYKQVSDISAMLFAPVARTYVGGLVAEAGRRQEKPLGDPEVVNLALRKLVFEAGEILMQTNPPTKTPIARYEFDDKGGLPDYSLAQVAAAALAYVKYRDEQKKAAQAEKATAPQVQVLGPATSVRALRSAARVQAYQTSPAAAATTARMTGGCGCGGSTSTPPAQPPPCYDPCAGGLTAVPPASEACGCQCSSCQTQPSADCDDMCSISCETKLRLRDCIKQLICDLLRWIDLNLLSKVPDDPANLGSVLKHFLECVIDAICPTPSTPSLPPGSSLPCLPCSYAVENP